MLSILVAARNEEKNIERLIFSLLQQDFPSQNFEILVADDDSTDETPLILKRLSTEFDDKIHTFRIDQKVEKLFPNLTGKTRALAYLAHQAKGDHFFICDADMYFPNTWLSAMFSNFQDDNQVGICNGITQVEESSILNTCQAIEWLSAQRIMYILTEFGVETTGIGNNMAVSKEAYWSTGGYENFPFSIVEDFALYKQIISRKFKFIQSYNTSVLGITKAPDNYFEQRKRWISGGMSSKSTLIIPSILQGVALPLLIAISYLNLNIGLGILSFIFLLNCIIGFSAFKPLKKLYLMVYMPIYTIYMLLSWFLQFAYYFLPTPLIWKGRKY